MSRFRGRLRVVARDDGRWMLLAPLAYDSARIGRVTVPSGFVTDFASVPRLPLVFWWFGDRAHQAAVIHDYLYQTHAVARAVADAVFFEAMEASGIGWFGRWAMWSGVRVGGWHAYGQREARAERLNPTSEAP